MTQSLRFILLLVFALAVTSCDSNSETKTVLEEPLPAADSAPIVKSSSTYSVSILDGTNNPNLIYAQALSHNRWNDSNTSTLNLRLDIYLPENAPDNRPAIILIHGGALENGTRKQPRIVELGNYFAERGWVALSLDYRLERNKGTTPQQWQAFAVNNTTQDNFGDQMAIYPANRDVKAAVRWLYANAERYGVNTDYITSLGNSAGALLSISLGTTDEEDFTEELTESDDPTLSSTNLDQPSKVHTIVDFWGGGGHVVALNSVFSLQRFDATDAPILIVHGDNDQIVPFIQAEVLRDRYQMTGATYEFHRLNGAGHEAWDETVNGMTLSELAADFIVRQQNLVVD